MDGMEGAIATVVERMTAALPGKTTQLRTRYDVDPETEGDQLPDVVTIAPYNRARLGVEEWPAVLIAGQETPNMRRADQPTIWLVTYKLRAFVWVRGDSGETVELVRQRLTLAVRELLLERKTMTDTLMVDDSSLRESFSELARDDTNATVAASYIEFNAWVQEELADAIPAYGTVEDTQVDTANLPPHPAL